MGAGKGYSVLEVVEAMKKASGKDIPLQFVGRRAGDVPVLYANCSRAEKELNWKAYFKIEEMCRDAWNWQQKNPNGYNHK